MFHDEETLATIYAHWCEENGHQLGEAIDDFYVDVCIEHMENRRDQIKWFWSQPSLTPELAKVYRNWGYIAVEKLPDDETHLEKTVAHVAYELWVTKTLEYRFITLPERQREEERWEETKRLLTMWLPTLIRRVVHSLAKLG